MTPKEHSAVLNRLQASYTKIQKLEAEVKRLRGAVHEERKRGVTERRDTVRLRWLFEKDNLDACVDLPVKCWEGTDNYRRAIDRARGLKGA